MEQESTTPNQEVTKLIREHQEANADQRVSDIERKRLEDIARRIRTFVNVRGDESVEALQKRQHALMLAIEEIAAAENIPPNTIIDLIWSERNTARWFRANVRENPEMPEQIQKALAAAEKTWGGLRQQPAEARESHPDSERLWTYLYTIENNLHDCSDTQLQELMTRQQLFRRLSSLFFNMHPPQDVDSRPPMRCLRILALRMPALAANEALASNYIEDATGLIRGVLGRRELFFAIARNGPVGTQGNDIGQSYMNYAWYRRMANDVENGTIRLPTGMAYNNNDPYTAGRQLMHLYNGGGFDMADTLVTLGSIADNPRIAEQLRRSRTIQNMFRLATHPSPVNGHVTLSAYVIVSLATLAERHPRLFDGFIDERDEALGQTPREFFAANASETGRIPFDDLTDPKRGIMYSSACRRLVAALGARAR